MVHVTQLVEMVDILLEDRLPDIPQQKLADGR